MAGVSGVVDVDSVAIAIIIVVVVVDWLWLDIVVGGKIVTRGGRIRFGAGVVESVWRVVIVVGVIVVAAVESAGSGNGICGSGSGGCRVVIQVRVVMHG